MRRKTVSEIVLTLLLVGLLTLTFNAVPATASLPVHNIDTGEDFTTIQAGIDAPETKEGHTIKVDGGIYYEHVTITKSISLVGENRNTTIIDGDGRGIGLNIPANDVMVINFTIRNAGKTWGGGFPDSCILVANGMNVHIENNTLTDAAVGMLGYASSNVTIYHNLVYNCILMGIHLDGNSVYCKIVNNTVMNSLEGIELERSAMNLVEGNRLRGNNVSIVLNQCGGLNVFRRNNMSSDWYNLIVWGWSLEAFMQDLDTSNIVNTKTVYYLTNSHNLIMNPSNYPNLGYLAAVNCTNITIRDIDLSFNGDGMLLVQSTNCTLANITLSGNHGPLLHGGLTFFKSNNNLIVNNRISNNSVELCLYRSDGNVFYHNLFGDNDRQVISNFHSPFSEPAGLHSINKWDDGYPSGGNYWSDFEERYPDAKELDDSGIWDKPYVIDENNQDNYPLMEPWSPKPPSPMEALEELIHTVKSWDLGTGIETSLTSKLQAAYRSLNRENQKASLGQLTAFINEVEALRDKKLRDEQADQLISQAQRIKDPIKG